MEEELEIKLQVGGTYYPLKIKRSEEYMYREAASQGKLPRRFNSRPRTSRNSG